MDVGMVGDLFALWVGGYVLLLSCEIVCVANAVFVGA
jgi:hypothetical protein